MNKIEKLYKEVKLKKTAIKAVSTRLGMSYNSVRNNILGGGFEPAEKHRAAIIEELKRVIKEQ